MNTQLFIRNNAHKINQMNEDDKSMHIFYTLESIEETVKELHNALSTEDPNLGYKIVELEQLQEMLYQIQKKAELFNKMSHKPVLA